MKGIVSFGLDRDSLFLAVYDVLDRPFRAGDAVDIAVAEHDLCGGLGKHPGPSWRDKPSYLGVGKIGVGLFLSRFVSPGPGKRSL